MKNFPGRTVEEITELAINLANQFRNKNTGKINKVDLVNGAWHQAASAHEQILDCGDMTIGRYYTLSTVSACAEKVADMIAQTGMVDIT